MPYVGAATKRRGVPKLVPEQRCLQAFEFVGGARDQSQEKNDVAAVRLDQMNPAHALRQHARSPAAQLDGVEVALEIRVQQRS